MPVAPRVFISYSHDDERHEDRVLDLANRLRAGGIDAEIDQYEMSPPEGWPAWCEWQIKKAVFVLLVCTETYLRRVNDEEEPSKGHGVLWEARIIRQLLYDAGSKTRKFVPVLFADGSPDHIPTPVKGAARFVIEDFGEYEALCRLLTNQPLARRPVLGKPIALPPRPRRDRHSDRSLGSLDCFVQETPHNALADCVELLVSVTQGSSRECFDFLPEVRFGVGELEVEGTVIRYGLKEASLSLELKGCKIIPGKRLGDEPHSNVIAKGNNKWVLVGPKDKGVLLRLSVGTEPLCRLSATTETEGKITARVECRTRDVKINQIGSTNKEKIIAIIIAKSIGSDRGDITLSEAAFLIKGK